MKSSKLRTVTQAYSKLCEVEKRLATGAIGLRDATRVIQLANQFAAKVWNDLWALELGEATPEQRRWLENVFG
jgi:hypothetical protein